MNDWPTKDAQIEAQADRAETLQKMYDDSQNYIKKLKAQLTPEAKATWIFQEAEHGEEKEA